MPLISDAPCIVGTFSDPQHTPVHVQIESTTRIMALPIKPVGKLLSQKHTQNLCIAFISKAAVKANPELKQEEAAMKKKHATHIHGSTVQIAAAFGGHRFQKR